VWPHHWLAVFLAPAAIWILLSGLDDLFIDFVFWFRRKKPFPWPAPAELAQAPQRRIAIFVPLWNEHAVIEQMLRHNLSVILYNTYDIFVGVYPNDGPTAEAVERVARDDARVHISVCPHDGPTSKGDCLNFIYAKMRAFEVEHAVRFEILMTHDAEDMVHPESLRFINWFSRDYQMVQIPVLPLPTRLREWTHGLYCDEFAEFQFKDIAVRQQLGGFLPSNGVGTGFERSALESLERRYQGVIFDPECLTEDYENGFRMHAAGFRQIFVPVRFGASGPVATREYFPRGWRAAIRQRSRWVAGIALQGWQYHGWRVAPLQAYWLWRDRKGLAGNLLSPLVNLLFFYWMAAWTLSATAVLPNPARFIPLWLAQVCLLSSAVSVLQGGMRSHLAARIYGWRFAAVAPLRIFLGNWINCAATVQAIHQFWRARVRREGLVWRKTDHVYYCGAAHPHMRPRLGEVLVSLRFISPSELEEALLQKPKGQRIGEYLVGLRKITWIDLDQALSSQAGMVGAWVAQLSSSPPREDESRSAESLRPARSPRPGVPA